MSTKPIMVSLDALTETCGYFCPDTEINNGYRCNHPDNEETSLMRIAPRGTVFKGNLEYKITAAAMRRQYGSMANITAALKTDEGKAFFAGLEEKMSNREFVSGFGCKIQGCCYSFSCPIAYQADLEDMKEHDEDLYEQWKDEEYGPKESGADWMVVHDMEIIARFNGQEEQP